VLDVIEREDLARHSASVGDLLGMRLHELARDHAAIAQVRQRGLLIGLELVDSEGQADDRGAAQIANHLRRDGVLIGTAGRHGNVLKVRPPLIFEPSHVDRLVAALSDALDALMPYRLAGPR
jgi:4-aminobutyrate aminotransferase-like enzyme